VTPTGGSGGTGGGSSDWTGDPRSGEATYYSNSGTVACSFQGTNNNMDIAAINAQDWDNGQWCGACADVAGPNGSVRVTIVDQCPECASGDLDLSQQAFAQIADVSAGRVHIDWHFVACDISGPVAYRFKDGTNQWWAAILVENSTLPVVSLEWSSDGSSWHNVTTREWNYFVEDSGIGAGPVYLRLTAVDGQQLVDQIQTVQEFLVVDGQTNFN